MTFDGLEIIKKNRADHLQVAPIANPAIEVQTLTDGGQRPADVARGIAGFLGLRWIKKGSPPTPDMAIDEAKRIKETVTS